jgi:PPOX class probable F420-dependent enzyme
VCYALVHGRIAIAVDEKPKASTSLARLRNIERDSRVALLFDRYDDDWAQLAWVRIEGRAEVVSRGQADPAALDQLRERYPQYGTMDLESRPLIRVTPGRVVGWRWQGG